MNYRAYFSFERGFRDPRIVSVKIHMNLLKSKKQKNKTI